ncbi:fructosamine kinase family protein [Luteipulveratus halotolerans]|uniref:Fructosamine kinase n=1 Tax=Luteipulveratus halotolerans TaxID=1631356 RepID=A0A0L6CP63_9MICO|nr:fructosamine kinase family protein [Luteipulveratus halotolerans]KNX39556.1 fructosamine kinase [Luteipulveratus halotolerans]
MPSPEAAHFVKTLAAAPPGYFAWEAAGLRWLAAAAGARVVDVVRADTDHLVLQRLTVDTPSRPAAEAFGRDLARTHTAGTPAYGSGPAGWDGDGWLGPSIDLLPLRLGAYERWGEMYAELRLLPLAHEGVRRGALTVDDLALVDRLGDRLRGAAYDTGEPPARLHGDLWAGKVIWTADGVVLIDPAAHGGHREADLAMLQLFGSPRLPTVLAAYDEVAPLVDGWQERVLLHQLHPLLLHAVVFGGGYVGQAMRGVQHYL